MPLSFDLPIEKLRAYQGSSPKPVDFDSFWDNSLEEVYGSEIAFELEPSGFDTDFADCFNLWFTAFDGARIYAKYLKPRSVSSQFPVVFHFHGYKGQSGDWYSKLPYPAQGMALVSMDCRGQSGLSEDLGGVNGNTQHGHIIRGIEGEPKDLLFRKIFLDTVQLVRVVRSLENIDERRMGTMGRSQGGALSLVCAALVPDIKKVASHYPFLSDYRRVWEMDQAENAYAEIKEFFYRRDPLHEREDEFFEKLGYIDIQHLMSRVKAEVLWPIGYSDKICPPSTQYAAYNKLNCPKQMLIYPDYGHVPLPYAEDKVLQFMKAL